MMMPVDKKELAQYIDHSLLSPTATEAQIRVHCAEAVKYGFYSVCIQPRWVDLAADILHESPVKVCTVAGFPLGANLARIKAFEADLAIASGADEIDMVADLASIIAGDEKYLLNDIRTVLRVCQSIRPFVILKVIIESAALTDEQIIFACRTIEEAGADFIKTSTGLHPAGGAKLEHVRLIAQSAPKCKIKAAGGVRTTADTLAMIEAGASRIGATKSIDIINGFSPSST
ncbi:MAG: deoxyribose-phosphate aldolase [Planctomycetes bacterium]|nr:deoxyribose-phosphate aldolase [Planctomycetota bacterium]